MSFNPDGEKVDFFDLEDDQTCAPLLKRLSEMGKKGIPIHELNMKTPDGRMKLWKFLTFHRWLRAMVNDPAQKLIHTLAKRDMNTKENLHYSVDEMRAIMLDSKVRELSQDLRSQTFQSTESVKVTFLKRKVDDPLSIELVNTLFHSSTKLDSYNQYDSDGNIKYRTIWKSDAFQQVAARAIQKLFGAYMKDRWDNSIIGSRAGIGSYHGLAALKAAVENYGCTTLLLFDATAYFDNIQYEMVRDLFHKVSGYRHCKELAHLVDDLMGYDCNDPESSKRKLPQGSALSPFFANILSNEKVVKICQEYGFTVNYVDDFIITFKNARNAREAFKAIEKKVKGLGVQMNMSKSWIVDLKQNRARSVMKDAEWQSLATGELEIPYLGFLPRLDERDKLQFHVSDHAFKNLAFRMSETVRNFGSRPINASERDHSAQLLSHITSHITGWLAFYGCGHMSSSQRDVLYHIIVLGLDWLTERTSPFQRHEAIGAIIAAWENSRERFQRCCAKPMQLVWNTGSGSRRVKKFSLKKSHPIAYYGTTEATADATGVPIEPSISHTWDTTRSKYNAICPQEGDEDTPEVTKAREQQVGRRLAQFFNAA